MQQCVRLGWRDRWRAGLFHVLATAATTAALGVLGGLVVVGVLLLSGADIGAADGDVVAARLLGVVPVMVITATGLGLAGGVLSAPWGRRRPAEWSRPVIAGLIGAFHLAGRLERARFDEVPFGAVEAALSVAVALALWTAIALATVLGAHRGGSGSPSSGTGAGGGSSGSSGSSGGSSSSRAVAAPVRPTGRAWRETLAAAGLFACTVTYLGVRA
jgi:hypothetical protein